MIKHLHFNIMSPGRLKTRQQTRNITGLKGQHQSASSAEARSNDEVPEDKNSPAFIPEPSKFVTFVESEKKSGGPVDQEMEWNATLESEEFPQKVMVEREDDEQWIPESLKRRAQRRMNARKRGSLPSFNYWH